MEIFFWFLSKTQYWALFWLSMVIVLLSSFASPVRLLSCHHLYWTILQSMASWCYKSKVKIIY